MSKEAPEQNSFEYKRQIDEIYQAIVDSEVSKSKLDEAMMVYMRDNSYARGAIIEAREKLLKFYFR